MSFPKWQQITPLGLPGPPEDPINKHATTLITPSSGKQSAYGKAHQIERMWMVVGMVKAAARTFIQSLSAPRLLQISCYGAPLERTWWAIAVSDSTYKCTSI